MPHTKIVCLEGLDGSGKTIQAKLLKEDLEREGKKVFMIDFPQYDSFFGTEIGRMLSGTDTVTADQVDVRSMSLWYAADRWNYLKDTDLSEYDFVIFNRYTLSNAVYQSARAYGKLEMEFVNWIFDLEHGQFGLPKPEQYFFLDVDLNFSKENIKEKGHRDYVGEQMDVYEKSRGLQIAAREIYLQMAEETSFVQVIPCMENDLLLPIETIHGRIMEKIHHLVRG